MIVIGCNCGGRRGQQAAAAIAAGNGVAAVWRLTHPNGSTVDYWDKGDADKAHAGLLAKETTEAAAAGRGARPVLLDRVDSRTGMVLT
ncbi:hypothetical protein AB0M39_35145 [Streptomyces sp. NPDC051907]|uniref:hypothetical protein n=1 Tax=Streptomyces sp. NPDC051907 TaxID=3155284 RepID=UPI003425A621